MYNAVSISIRKLAVLQAVALTTSGLLIDRTLIQLPFDPIFLDPLTPILLSLYVGVLRCVCRSTDRSGEEEVDESAASHVSRV